MDKNSLTLLLAQGVTVEQIGRRFGKHPSTVSYWMAKHGLVAPNREQHAAKGGIERERLEEMVERGVTIAEIADEVGLSKGTVRHWLGRYGLNTRNGRGTRGPGATQAGKDAGLVNLTMICPRHGETEFFLEGRGYYRCRRCRTDAAVRRRRKVKAILVAEADGKCRICGYDRHGRALHFHHLDPSLKRMALSAQGVAYALETLRAEARKCVLLCSNCHAEVEAGIRSLPLR